jgi:hypothetical protein
MIFHFIANGSNLQWWMRFLSAACLMWHGEQFGERFVKSFFSYCERTGVFFVCIILQKTAHVKYKLHWVRGSGRPHISRYKAITNECFFQHYQWKAAWTGSVISTLWRDINRHVIDVDDARRRGVAEIIEPSLSLMATSSPIQFLNLQSFRNHLSSGYIFPLQT